MENFKTPRRVFVGIHIKEEIAESCLDLQSGLADLPVRFIPPEDIHLTLVPPWETADPREAEEKLREALRHARRFILKLQKLSYGPDKMRPKFVWILCGASEEIIALKKNLLKALGLKDPVPFVPHVTIARFKEGAKAMPHERSILRPVAFSMPVESVTLFESPHGGGSGYKVLAVILIPFGGIS